MTSANSVVESAHSNRVAGRGLESFEEFARRVADEEGSQEWWVDGLLPRRGIAMLVGEPMSGKSLVMQILTAASQADAMHYEFVGRVVEEARVLYLHLEHQGTTLIRTMRAAALARGAPLTGVFVEAEFDLDSDEDVERVRQLADQNNINVIVIDSLRRASIANENDSNDVALWARQLRHLTSGGRRLVVVIHHLGKGAKGPRGSTDLKAMVDTLLTLTRHGETARLKAEHHHAAPQEVSFVFQHEEQNGRLDALAADVPAPATSGRGITDSELLESLVRVVTERPGIGATDLQTEMGRRHGGLRNGRVKTVRDQAAADGRIRTERDRGAIRCFPVAVAPFRIAPPGI